MKSTDNSEADEATLSTIQPLTIIEADTQTGVADTMDTNSNKSHKQVRHNKLGKKDY